MKKKHTPFICAMALILPLNTFAQNWSAPVLTETIADSYGSVGERSSLQTVNSNPAISYYDSSNGYLKYIRATDASGTAWAVPVSIDYIYGGGQFVYTSLQTVNGNPAIAYYSANSNDLKYVRALDSLGITWGAPISIDVTGIVGEYASLQIVNGNPAIAYYNATGGNLKYVRALDVSGLLWAAPISIDVTGDVGESASLQIINGNPAISYKNGIINNSHLKYVRAMDPSGTVWGTPVNVDLAAGVGDYTTSLQEVNGNPAISYFDGTNDNLKYVRASDALGTTWSAPISIDVTGNIGIFSSLQVVNGAPAISYQATDGYNLKYIRATDSSGTTWAAPILIDIIGDVGYHTSLQIINGNPAVSYHDQTNGDLKYVRASDSSGTVWTTAIPIDGTGNVGFYPSLQIINGNPAFSYYDAHNRDLKYVHAIDAAGTTWAAPVSVDVTGNVGKYTSLEIVNGIPAISYFDQTNGDLKYIHALDSSGTTWGAPVSFYETAAYVLFSSLKIVNGNPAISYYDGWFGRLKYVRAMDPSGTVWSTPVTIDGLSGNDVGRYNSLQVVNGNPAISYATNFALKYVRATNSSGTAWSAPITVDGIAGNEQHTSLQIVNGNPAISYYDATNGDLKYVRASNSSGTVWAAPVSIDVAGSVGKSTSLQIINGNPAISYYDATNGDLKYVRAFDVSGTTWSAPVSLDVTGNVGLYTSMIPMGIGAGIVYYNPSKAVPYFISGNTSTEVWPGDANHDYIVNNNDLLPIGLHYSQTGPPRISITNNWQGYAASDWGVIQTNGQDLKYIDSNGDGIIDANDTLAVDLNFSLTHAISNDIDNILAERSAPNLYFVSTAINYNAGSWVDIEVWAGNLTTQVSNLYGLAFNINYDASIVQPGTESITYPASWLGIPGTDAIKIAKVNPSATLVYGAITRIDHINKNGYGKIADFKFQIKTSLTAAATMHFSLSNYQANDSVGAVRLFNPQNDSIFINQITTNINESNNSIEISIYPNPFTSQTSILFTEVQNNSTIKIVDVLGEVVKTIHFSGKQLIIEKGEMNCGIYFIQVIGKNNFLVNKKVVIQ